MSGGGTIRPNAVINLGLFSLTFNILITATGFAIVAGVSFLRGGSLAGVFGPAAGFLVLIATMLGVLRSALVTLFEGLAP